MAVHLEVASGETANINNSSEVQIDSTADNANQTELSTIANVPFSNETLTDNCNTKSNIVLDNVDGSTLSNESHIKVPFGDMKQLCS